MKLVKKDTYQEMLELQYLENIFVNLKNAEETIEAFQNSLIEAVESTLTNKTELHTKHKHTPWGNNICKHFGEQYLGNIIYNYRKPCIRQLNIMKILSKKTWGANTVFILEFYCKYITAKVDYASLFYNIASKSTLNKLEVIQNSALRIAFGARSTTPISFLLIGSGIVNLQTRREQQMLKHLKRIWLVQ